ncbi:MAG: hypothetical protein COB24_10930 [Hyphomicrobiales bacterium]|nr:MAG: hypothetical protein COB24_10930 [Hyphomicrobiales bacterium]
MLYSILIYESEARVADANAAEQARVMDGHHEFQAVLKQQNKLLNVVRLMPTSTAVTRPKDAPIIDGPFAETKEQFVGFYMFEADNLDEAIELSKHLPDHEKLEIRPVMFYEGVDGNGSSTIINNN